MRALIFDMDGTLVDSEKYWVLMPRVLLFQYGISYTDEEWQRLPWRVNSFHASLKNYFALPDPAPDRSFEECEAWCIDYMYHRVYPSPDKVLLKPDADETVRAAAALDLPMCVLSATPTPLIDYTLRNNGIREPFDFIDSTYHAQSKRHPELFHKTAKRLGTTADQCLVLEDSLYAIESAKQAGCMVWAIHDDKQIPDREAIRRTADRYFETHAEMAAALRALA